MSLYGSNSNIWTYVDARALTQHASAKVLDMQRSSRTTMLQWAVRTLGFWKKKTGNSKTNRAFTVKLSQHAASAVFISSLLFSFLGYLCFVILNISPLPQWHSNFCLNKMRHTGALVLLTLGRSLDVHQKHQQLFDGKVSGIVLALKMEKGNFDPKSLKTNASETKVT